MPLRQDDHGVVRIGETRVRLDTVVIAWKLGDSAEQIAGNFDVLNLADIYAVISYYLNNRDEVDKYLCENQQAGDFLRAELELSFPTVGIRERLLARREQLVGKES